MATASTTGGGAEPCSMATSANSRTLVKLALRSDEGVTSHTGREPVPPPAGSNRRVLSTHTYEYNRRVPDEVEQLQKRKNKDELTQRERELACLHLNVFPSQSPRDPDPTIGRSFDPVQLYRHVTNKPSSS